jgi:hypothetical protein
MGKSYLDELPENHREAIRSAIAMLTDEFMDDVALVLTSEKPDISGTAMAATLPPQFAQRYTALFAKKYLAAFNAAAWKMTQAGVHELSCVAEEFAAEAVVSHAEAILELDGEESDFGLFRDGIFEDMDFRWLFHAEMDGIEDSDIAEEMVMVNLRFEDWFKRFSDEHPRVPPYVENE